MHNIHHSTVQHNASVTTPRLVDRQAFQQFSCRGCDRWFSSKHRLEVHHARCRAYRMHVVAVREQREAREEFEKRLQRERDAMHDEYAAYIAELKTDIQLLQTQLQTVLRENEQCVRFLEELQDCRRREAEFEQLLSGDPSDLFAAVPQTRDEPPNSSLPPIPYPPPDIPLFSPDLTIEDFFSQPYQ